MTKNNIGDKLPPSQTRSTPASGESKRVIINDQLKICFDRERDSTENLWSRLGLPLPEDEPKLPVTVERLNELISNDERVDRGRRAIRKGNVLAVRTYGKDFANFVSKDRQIIIRDSVAKIGLSQEQCDGFSFYTIFNMAQMIASRYIEGTARNSKVFSEFLDNAKDLIETLHLISTSIALGSSFNIAIRNKLRILADDARIELHWETTEDKAKDLKTLLYFGDVAEIMEFVLSSMLIPIAELQVSLSEGNTIRNYSAEYKFVFEIARGWWGYTNRIPTVSRGERTGRSVPRRPSFQQFIEAIAPEIGAETIRSALSVFKAAVGSESPR